MKLRISAVMVSAIFIFCLLPLSVSADNDLAVVQLVSPANGYNASYTTQVNNIPVSVSGSKNSVSQSFVDENNIFMFSLENYYTYTIPNNTKIFNHSVSYGYPNNISFVNDNYFSLEFYCRDSYYRPFNCNVSFSYSGNSYYVVEPVVSLVSVYRSDGCHYIYQKMYFHTSDFDVLDNLDLGYTDMIVNNSFNLNLNGPAGEDYYTVYYSYANLIYGYREADIVNEISRIIENDNANTELIIDSITDFQNLLAVQSSSDVSAADTYTNRINQYYAIEDALVNGSVDLQEWETIIETGDSAIISNASAINFISNIMQSFYNSIGADLRSVYGFWAFMCIFSVILASGAVIGRNVGKSRDRNEYKDD